jgi:hypothetical protein
MDLKKFIVGIKQLYPISRMEITPVFLYRGESRFLNICIAKTWE